MHDSTFQLHKVKANLQAMKKHLANFRELSGGDGGGGGENMYVCVLVEGGGGADDIA